MAKVVDEAEASQVLDAFRLYADQGRSSMAIARDFNDREVGGRRTWDGSTIRQMLRRRTYAGIETFRTVRYERDPETGHVTTIRRPRREWKVRRLRQLQVVPWSLWKRANKRLNEAGRAYSRDPAQRASAPHRTALSPKTLFRPVCSYCKKPLRLGRAGKYASYCCPFGVNQKHGCQLRSYKSVRIVDTVVLHCLREHCFTPAFLENAVRAANSFLAEEASRPREDTQNLQKQIRSEQRQRDQLARKIDEHGAHDLGSLVDLLRQREAKVKELRERLQVIEARNELPPPAIEPDDLAWLLEDLRALLTQDVGQAAPLLGELTGPIEVTQDEQGKRRPGWTARFEVNLVPVAAHLAAERDCPTAGTWEYLYRRGWTHASDVVLPLVEPPRNAHLATRFLELRAQGLSVSAIARAHGLYHEEVNQLIHLAETGEWRSSWWCRRYAKHRSTSKVALNSEAVARMRDQEGLPFRLIAEQLGISEPTAYRAYEHAHPEVLATAVVTGSRPQHGVRVDRGAARRDKLEQLLRAGFKPKEIAEFTACPMTTIYRIKRQLMRKAGNPAA